MKTIRKITALAAALGCAFAMTAAPCAQISAADELTGTTGSNAEWRFDVKTGTLTVSGSCNAAWGILSRKDGSDRAVSTVVLPEDTEISSYSYSWETAATPDGDSVTVILKVRNSVSVPANTPIESVSYCRAAGDLTIPEQLADYEVQYDMENTYVPPVLIRHIVIGEGIQTISADAFSMLENLETVQLPESLRNINDLAFSGCPKLETVSIPAKAEVSTLAFLGSRTQTEIRLKPPVCYDMNSDGAVSVADAVMLSRCVNEDFPGTVGEGVFFDLDGDGILTIRDITKMLAVLQVTMDSAER